MPGDPFPTLDPDTEQQIHRAPLGRVPAEHGPDDGLPEPDEREREDALAELARQRAQIREEAAQRDHERAEALKQPTVPDTIARLLERRLREARQEALAQIVATHDYAALSEENKARLDALVYGIGYVHDGKRLDPTTITVHRPPAHLHQRYPQDP